MIVFFGVITVFIDSPCHDEDLSFTSCFFGSVIILGSGFLSSGADGSRFVYSLRSLNLEVTELDSVR